MKLEELVVDETRGRKADYRSLQERARDINQIKTAFKKKKF